MNRPKIYKKDNTTFIENAYGSFVNKNDYGLAQQKNALSEKELKKLGYRRIQ